MLPGNNAHLPDSARHSKRANTSDDLLTYILFNGLDTFADISFCGKHIASTDNQFRQWRFDVSDAVRSCASERPELGVSFASAPSMAEYLASQPGAETWPWGIEAGSSSHIAPSSGKNNQTLAGIGDRHSRLQESGKRLGSSNWHRMRCTCQTLHWTFTAKVR